MRGDEGGARCGEEEQPLRVLVVQLWWRLLWGVGVRGPDVGALTSAPTFSLSIAPTTFSPFLALSLALPLCCSQPPSRRTEYCECSSGGACLRVWGVWVVGGLPCAQTLPLPPSEYCVGSSGGAWFGVWGLWVQTLAA